jgi:hypothetical protein
MEPMEESTTTGSRKLIFEDNYGDLLKWPEYLVFGAVLASTMGTGVFYRFFKSKKDTEDLLMMGGKSMSVVPVTLSSICRLVKVIYCLFT